MARACGQREISTAVPLLSNPFDVTSPPFCHGWFFHKKKAPRPGRGTIQSEAGLNAHLASP
jgi:hypothetical protein